MSYRRAKALSLAVFERAYLTRLLRTCDGDVALASVPRGTFYRLLKKRDIVPSDYR